MRAHQEQQRLDMLAFQERTFELLKADNQMKKTMMETRENSTIERKTKCPAWDKSEPIKRFLPRLRIWNNIQKHNGKYLDLLEALQNSERKKEKDKIELEVQKNNLNPEDPQIMDNIILKLEHWFAKPGNRRRIQCLEND